MKEQAPTNDYAALKLALRLAISAPDDEKFETCVAYAEELAARLPAWMVKAAQRAVI